jgi:hypothetical protein
MQRRPARPRAGHEATNASWQPGEGLSEATIFIARPDLFADGDAMRAAINSWPLQPVLVLNGG